MPNLVAHAAIIAGGASRRMGSCKALLKFKNEFLIARVARVLRSLFDEVIVVTQNPEVARAAGVLAIPDIYENKGPLGGVHAALSHFQKPTFCVACDLPFLNPEIIEFLCGQFCDCADGYEILAPRIKGRMETLHAIYAPSILQVLELELKNQKVHRAEQVLAASRVKFIEENQLKIFDSDLKFLTNLNTPDDAQAAGFSL